MQKSLVPEKKTAELFFYTENVIAVQQLVSTLKFWNCGNSSKFDLFRYWSKETMLSEYSGPTTD